MSDELEVLKRVARRLTGAGIPYMVPGSLAMNYYGRKRDIDLVVEYDTVGLHVGQDDTPPQVAREQLGPNRLLGLSTHALDQAKAQLELQRRRLSDLHVRAGVREPRSELQILPVPWPTRAAQMVNDLEPPVVRRHPEIGTIKAWLKDLAPSPRLRSWYGHDLGKWEEFQRRYRAELESNPEAWKPVLEEARRGNVTLLYSARDMEHNSALLLKSFLEKKM